MVLALSLAVSARAQEAVDPANQDVAQSTDDTPADMAPVPRLKTIRDDTVVVRKKRKPVTDPYEATGLRLGSFKVLPKLEVGAVGTSNVGASSTAAQSDMGLRLKPSMTLSSDWSRHELTAKASAEFLHYLDNSDLSSQNADVSAALRLDLRHDLTGRLESQYALSSQGASNTEVPDTAVGNRKTQSFGASTSLTHDGGILALTGKAGFSRSVYSDVQLSGGGTEDNSDRDYTEYALSLRGSLNTGATLRPFAEVAYTPRRHDAAVDRNGLHRNSQGYEARIGLTFDDDPVWSGEVALSYMIRDYADATLKTARAPGLIASVTWRPTDLTKIELSSAVALNETASLSDGATTSWTNSAIITQALRENLDVTAGVSAGFSKGSSGSDATYGAKLGAAYSFNPLLAVSLGYEGTFYRGSTAASDYDDHRILASLILQR
jgi:hypothetical protein